MQWFHSDFLKNINGGKGCSWIHPENTGMVNIPWLTFKCHILQREEFFFFASKNSPVAFFNEIWRHFYGNIGMQRVKAVFIDVQYLAGSSLGNLYFVYSNSGIRLYIDRMSNWTPSPKCLIHYKKNIFHKWNAYWIGWETA